MIRALCFELCAHFVRNTNILWGRESLHSQTAAVQCPCTKHHARSSENVLIIRREEDGRVGKGKRKQQCGLCVCFCPQIEINWSSGNVCAFPTIYFNWFKLNSRSGRVMYVVSFCAHQISCDIFMWREKETDRNQFLASTILQLLLSCNAMINETLFESN